MHPALSLASQQIANSADLESIPSPKAEHSLWLCCYFPRLPLEALEMKENEAGAVVVMDRGRPQVLAASRKAQTHGVLSGQPLNAAYALCPNLQVRTRDEELEKAALHQLAEHCLSFSPWISLDHPQALLLEIGNSLRLFGGAEALKNRLQDLIIGKGHSCRTAITVAPLASWLLASHGTGGIVPYRESLRSALGNLPIESLVGDGGLVLRLSKSGLRTLRDLWRLPRDGLNRRFGLGLLEELDRAAGVTPEVLRFYQTPAHFEARLDLNHETDRIAHYFPALEELTRRLTLFLRSCSGAVSGLVVTLHHERVGPSRTAIELSQTTCDDGFLLRLFREKLERTPLQAPVTAVSLYTGKIQRFMPAVADLFGTRVGPTAAEEWTKLLEVLRARLGRNAVRRFRVRQDHRPERASELAEQASPYCVPPTGARPLWLLPRAQPAPARLRFISGTERIEAGWWDGHGISRDYRMATDRRGVRYWVYREPAGPDEWYCHGLFG